MNRTAFSLLLSFALSSTVLFPFTVILDRYKPFFPLTARFGVIKTMQKRKKAEEYVDKIKALRDPLDKLAQPFRVDPQTSRELPFYRFSADDWRRNTFGNALVMLRQQVENNFNFIETMRGVVVSE